MKNCFSIALCFVLFFLFSDTSVGSQPNKGRIHEPSLHNIHRGIHQLPPKGSPPTLQKLLNSGNNIQEMGFDPDQFGAPVNATITNVQQAANETYLVQILIQAWNTDTWANFFRYTYTYNKDGDRIGELREIWQGSNWANQMRIAYTYLAVGIISTQLWEIWQVTQWVNYQRGIHSYNGNFLLTAVLWEYWQLSLWVNYYQYLYTYDGSDREINYTVQQWISNAWVNYYRYLYAYFTASLLLEVVSQDWISNAWTNYGRETYTYENGKPKQLLFELWNGTAWNNDFLYSYTYGITNLLLTYLVQQWVVNAWVNFEEESYSYDANDDLTELVLRRWNGIAWFNVYRYLHYYTLKRLLSEYLYQYWGEVSASGASMSGDIAADSGWVNSNRSVRTYSSLTSVGNETPGNGTFRLYENYPNPFNPSTEVRFEVRGSGFVSLKIFDLLGREIETLVSETLPTGAYSRRWIATGQPSGVYFYRLQTGTYSEQKKMVLLK